MEDVIHDLVMSAQRCEDAARAFDAANVQRVKDRLQASIGEVALTWSGSFMGYHACIYTDGFRPKRPSDHFDGEWGGEAAHSNSTSGRWAEYSESDVRAEILRRANVTDADFEPLAGAATHAGSVFEKVCDELLPTLDAILAHRKDETIQRVRTEIRKTPSHLSQKEILAVSMRGREVRSRDQRASTEGFKVPYHMKLDAKLVEQLSFGFQLRLLAKQARYVITYLQKRKKMAIITARDVAGDKVFIGHGHSPLWRDLKDLLRDRLGIECVEFNSSSTAGLSNKERLNEMLEQSSFAFLIMTGEDEHSDGKVHARENVVHEAGLFQGRLGFERAIVLLEEGCEEFSNIHGISEIRFPKGNLKAAFEDVRQVLEREQILSPQS